MWIIREIAGKNRKNHQNLICVACFFNQISNWVALLFFKSDGLLEGARRRLNLTERQNRRGLSERRNTRARGVPRLRLRRVLALDIANSEPQESEALPRGSILAPSAPPPSVGIVQVTRKGLAMLVLDSAHQGRCNTQAESCLEKRAVWSCAWARQQAEAILKQRRDGARETCVSRGGHPLRLS